MTLNKFRILCLLVFLAVYIPVAFFTPIHIANLIFWPIAGWQLGGWVSELSDKLAVKFGYTN